MRRIEPAFPDLLPITHRLGPPPFPANEDAVGLDPVEMRLVRQSSVRPRGVGDRSLPRRPVRLLVHAATVAREPGFVRDLSRGGSGMLIALDGELSPEALPAPSVAGQFVALTPWLPEIWGGAAIPSLHGWRARGLAAGVLLCLVPAPHPFEQVERGVCEAREAGAQFVVSSPVAVPAEDRHRIYDRQAGEAGDESLENLLFHTDLGQLLVALERAASRVCRGLGMPEWLPGPATSLVTQATFSSATQLLLWARRLDLLEGVGSAGWQLRRAAHALLASRRDPQALVADDNLRVVPGFSPWVEAFARSLWSGGGEPFEGVQARWLAH
jgi:hypothetical protein